MAVRPPLQAGGKPKLKKRPGSGAVPAAEEKKAGVSSELAAKLNRRRRQQGEATDGKPRMEAEEASDPQL